MKKTLQKCKKIVANNHAFSNWDSLMMRCEKHTILYFTDLANKMYYEQSESEEAIKFATWYSRMDEEKVKNAYQRYIRELQTSHIEPKTPEK